MAVYRNEIVTKSGSLCLDGQTGCTGNYTGRKIDVTNGIPALYFPFEPEFYAGAGAAGKSTVNIVIYGSGTVNTSGADQPLQNRSSITVPTGYSVYFQAVPAPGYRFQDWTSQDGAKSTSNPFTAVVTKNGTMSATFVPDKGTGTGTDGSLCPKGVSYGVGLVEALQAGLGQKVCDSGYTLTEPAFGALTKDCVCDSQKDKYFGLDKQLNPLKPILDALPLLIGAAILIAVLGMFKK